MAIMRLVVVCLLAAVALADLTPDKIALLPGLWPRERRAVNRALKQADDPHATLRGAGIAGDLVTRLDAITSGACLNERYAHALVRTIPTLTDKQRRLFAQLVPATDGAQQALLAQRTRLEHLPSSEGEALRKRLRAQFDLQHVRIEKRFWRVALYALTKEQRAWMRPRQLQPYSFPLDALNHVYQLPGLTPSQAARVQALVTEYESESAADAAENARLQTELTRADPTKRERLQKAAQAVTDRLAYRLKDVIERSVAIYTGAQIKEIDAIPPMTSAADRHRHPGDLLHGLTLTPDQTKRAHALGRRIQRAHQKAGRELNTRRRKLAAAEMGSDAPQALTMQMMQHNATAERVAAMEQAGRKLVLEVLTPSQVATWVVSPHER